MKKMMITLAAAAALPFSAQAIDLGGLVKDAVKDAAAEVVEDTATKATDSAKDAVASATDEALGTAEEKKEEATDK